MPTNFESGLAHELSELVQTLRHDAYSDVEGVLDEVTKSAVRSVPGAHHAGITIASKDGKVRTASATSSYPSLLDEIQQRHRVGPCLAADWEHHIIRIDDLATERRWAAYCREGAEDTPIRSILAYQLFANRTTMAALNLYAEQPHAFDEAALEVGFIFATHAALAWTMARRDEQFRSALASRDIIGQAKGMIMERCKIDAVRAFELLKRLSQSSNTPLTVVANQLVEAEQRGS